MGLLPLPVEISSRAVNSAAVGVLGTHGLFLINCDGRMVDEQQ